MTKPIRETLESLAQVLRSTGYSASSLEGLRKLIIELVDETGGKNYNVFTTLPDDTTGFPNKHVFGPALREECEAFIGKALPNYNPNVRMVITNTIVMSKPDERPITRIPIERK